MEIRPWILRKINVFLLVCVVAALAFFAVRHVMQLMFIHEVQDGGKNSEQLQADSAKKNTNKSTLPKSFTQTKTQYEAIQGPFLSLEQGKHTAKLPDLRSILLYYGKNLRPDSTKAAETVLMGFRGDVNLTVVPTNTPMYLTFGAKGASARWGFSEDNKKTPLWITLEPGQDVVKVQLNMQDQDGNMIKNPWDFASFTVKEYPMPLTTPASAGWKIGEETVDHTLLQKEKAKWYGKDLFLELYGGEQYADISGKERIQFQTDEHTYAVFVQEGDALTYEEGEWHMLPLGEQTIGKPLLVAKTIDERRILFDLWDEAGKRRFQLELLKTNEPPIASKKIDMKLIGARSKTNWTVSIQGKRSQIRTDDWLLFQNADFQIIKTEQEIDEYIESVLQGELLVLEGIVRGEQGTYLQGNLFSASHAQMEPIRITMQNQKEQNDKDPAGKKLPQQLKNDAEFDEDDGLDEYTDDDEDDDDDDFDYA